MINGWRKHTRNYQKLTGNAQDIEINVGIAIVHTEIMQAMEL